MSTAAPAAVSGPHWIERTFTTPLNSYKERPCGDVTWRPRHDSCMASQGVGSLSYVTTAVRNWSWQNVGSWRQRRSLFLAGWWQRQRRTWWLTLELGWGALVILNKGLYLEYKTVSCFYYIALFFFGWMGTMYPILIHIGGWDLGAPLLRLHSSQSWIQIGFCSLKLHGSRTEVAGQSRIESRSNFVPHQCEHSLIPQNNAYSIFYNGTTVMHSCG